jgi:hypothetical protein
VTRGGKGYVEEGGRAGVAGARPLARQTPGRALSCAEERAIVTGEAAGAMAGNGAETGAHTMSARRVRELIRTVGVTRGDLAAFS